MGSPCTHKHTHLIGGVRPLLIRLHHNVHAAQAARGRRAGLVHVARGRGIDKLLLARFSGALGVSNVNM